MWMMGDIIEVIGGLVMPDLGSDQLSLGVG